MGGYRGFDPKIPFRSWSEWLSEVWLGHKELKVRKVIVVKQLQCCLLRHFKRSNVFSVSLMNGLLKAHVMPSFMVGRSGTIRCFTFHTPHSHAKVR